MNFGKHNWEWQSNKFLMIKKAKNGCFATIIDEIRNLEIRKEALP